MFGTLVELGVLDELYGSLIVREERGWCGRRKAEAGEKAAKPDGFFDGFRHGNELRFSGGVGSASLALAAPGDGTICDEEEVPCAGFPIVMVASVVCIAVSFESKVGEGARV